MLHKAINLTDVFGPPGRRRHHAYQQRRRALQTAPATPGRYAIAGRSPAGPTPEPGVILYRAALSRNLASGSNESIGVNASDAGASPVPFLGAAGAPQSAGVAQSAAVAILLVCSWALGARWWARAWRAA